LLRVVHGRTRRVASFKKFFLRGVFFFRKRPASLCVLNSRYANEKLLYYTGGEAAPLTPKEKHPVIPDLSQV